LKRSQGTFLNHLPAFCSKLPLVPRARLSATIGASAYGGQHPLFVQQCTSLHNFRLSCK
jgi:hypothetical protein